MIWVVTRGTFVFYLGCIQVLYEFFLKIIFKVALSFIEKRRWSESLTYWMPNWPVQLVTFRRAPDAWVSVTFDDQFIDKPFFWVADVDICEEISFPYSREYSEIRYRWSFLCRIPCDWNLLQQVLYHCHRRASWTQWPTTQFEKQSLENWQLCTNPTSCFIFSMLKLFFSRAPGLLNTSSKTSKFLQSSYHI